MFLKNFTELLFLVVLFLPGYVSIKVWDAFMPYRERAFPRTVFDALTYSVANLLFCSIVLFQGPWLLQVASHPPSIDGTALLADADEAKPGPAPTTASNEQGAASREYTWVDGVRFVAILFLLPVIYPSACIWLSLKPLGRRWRAKLKLTPLIPQAWDSLWFDRKRYLVLVQLTDDSYVGGYFGRESSASQWPAEPELYLEEAWFTDENAKLLGPVPRSAGLLISGSKIKTIELWDVVAAEAGTHPTDESLESQDSAAAEDGNSDA